MTERDTGLSPERSNPSESTNDLEAKLRKQIQNWQSKLLDLGNRNALINCSFNPTRGVVELIHPNTETIWRKLAADGAAGSSNMRFPWRRELVPPPPGYDEEDNDSPEGEPGKKKKEWLPSLDDCKASRKQSEQDLLTGIGDKVLERRLRTFASQAQLSLSEQGVHCLYVAFGFLKWFESVDSDIEHLSPLMLVPVTLSRTTADAPWDLTEAEDDAIDNLCLRERLKQDFGMVLPELPDIDALEEDGARLRFLDNVRRAIVANERWEVLDRCTLGRFAFPKVAMWQDLGDHVASVLTNGLCRSIGGDGTAAPQQAFGISGPLPEAATLDDEIAPGEIKTILDCDSSQLEAILAARRGVSFVLDGPPGTGKSQTIANIIADALSQGRRVLFVSEKVSALEVVKRRLDDCGLGPFCLECHSSKANRKAVLEELKSCLDLPVEIYDDTSTKMNEAKQKRSHLNEYVRSIHRRRDPLGISPYELFGHVSRYHRLGFSVKSRCPLPGIDGLDRSKFDEWLGLVDRARDSADVIRQNDTHPWRGCQLTVRALTLTDDLHHHLTVLTHSFGVIDQVTKPLVLGGLISDDQTPATLNELNRRLRESLTSPSVPESWFTSPRDVAATILRRCEMDGALERHRADLSSFVDDVEECFPDEQLAGLSSDRDVMLRRFLGTLPATVRRQHEFLVEPTQNLRNLVDSTEAAIVESARVISLLPVPVRTEMSTAKMPAVVSLARLIARVLPLRPEWLVGEYWPRLREASRIALSSLEEASSIAKRLENRLKANQLVEFSRSIVAPNQLQGAWNAVRVLARDGDSEQMASLQQKVQLAVQAVREVQAATQDILSGLGIEATGLPTLALTRSLEKAVPLVSSAVTLPGQWRDAGIRSRIRSVCEEAISDLREAATLRQQLEERLSHRAFKSTAAPLADRAQSFQSTWKRMFGGFKAYRQEVADLFKAGVPATPQMLADLTQLRTWHRRVSEAVEAANSLAPNLPQQFAADELNTWIGTEESLRKFEHLINDVPELVPLLPSRLVSIDGASLESALVRVRAQRESLSSAIAGTGLESLIEEGLPLSDVVNRLNMVSEAIASCQSARGTVAPYYVLLPKTFSTIVDDLRLANEYSRHLDETNVQFWPLVDLLPANSSPSDPAMWKRVQDSIQAAEQLGKLTRTLVTYQDALCREERLDPAALTAAAQDLETTHQRQLAAVHQIASRLELFQSDPDPSDLTKRPLTELLAAAREAIPVLEGQLQSLASLLPVFRPDSDLNVDALSDAQSFVAAARKARTARDGCDQTLSDLGIDLDHGLQDGGFQEAQWLQQQSAEGTVNPLFQAVACKSDVRGQVTHAVTRIREAAGPDFQNSMKFLRTVFPVEAATGRGIPIANMSLDLLAEFLDGLRSEMASLDDWLKFSRWKRDMEEQGFQGVVQELLAGKYEPEEAKNIIAARFFRQAFDQLAQEERLLGEFDFNSHEEVRERYRKLDEWEVRVASSRIRQFQLGRSDRPRSGWFTEATSELGMLQKEVQKKRRQLPLRKLFSEVPSVLQRLKPCIMMSPLSVSTFLQSDEIRFELVIFDEASQVFPWDAIGAIYRGTQLIVAGDEKQLPPTNFFNRADIESDNEDEDDLADYESILSLCKSIGMPGRRLRWHYRSRREPLIAFSNRHFYSGDLVTFPSVRDATGDAVRLEHVPQGRWIDRANRPEAERVTELVILHLRVRPKKSLGIIALNQSQQVAIEDAIYDRRRKYPVVDALFQIGLTEPLFVKNLENVQGDERDCIIISMGYGYNEAGKFLKNFGPLSKAGGERRLNVAVTRAKEEIILVASVKAADIDLSGSTSQGAHLLKAYLEYAERGVDSLARQVASVAGDAESPFEEEVAKALIQHGLTPVPQVGCGGFRIDLALKHPTRTGEFCLGIECDGATYHSSKTARDRDRIRQNVLESLGWKIIRVWSTDWIRNPQRQVRRILAEYELRTTSAPTDLSLPNLEALGDDELGDPQPQVTEAEKSHKFLFKAIKDVPEDLLHDMFQLIIRRSGAIDPDGLIQLTARELGFSRIGSKIRERLMSSLNKQLAGDSLRWVGDRITLATDEPA